MIIKQCQFSGKDENGTYVHLVHPGYYNDHLIKTAEISPPQMAQVQNYLKNMSRADGWLYTLVSALGAGEYWGSNSNADYFGMDALLHTPPGWDRMPADQQKLQGARWEWGYPTFYNAHAFQHHQNKDPARAIGNVEYVLWDSRMKRVLLIIGLNRAKARKEGAIDVIDRIENGEHPDVSMGTKVPFDLCSICCDIERIRPLLSTPQKIVQLHRQNPIQGVSCTTSEYCQHLKFELNKIYPDGRKVMMRNLHPRFFDLSYVLIGADKTSKVLAKLASGLCPIKNNAPMCKQGCTMCNPQGVVPSSHIHEVWSKTASVTPARGTSVEPQSEPTNKEDPMDKDEARILNKKMKTKTAEELFESTIKGPSLEKVAYGIEDFDVDPAEEDEISSYYKSKLAPGRLVKRSEIDKRITSHFSKKALPALESSEPDLPSDVQEEMAKDVPGALATSGSLGMVVKPKEFQRIMLISCGKKDMADDLESSGMLFPEEPPDGHEKEAPMMGRIIPKLLSALLPLMKERSAFGPSLHKRIVIKIRKPEGGAKLHRCASGDHDLMDKLSSLYSTYRKGLIYSSADLVKTAMDQYPQVMQHIFGDDLVRSFGGGLVKQGGDVMELILGGSLPVVYLNQAYSGRPVSGYIQENPGLDRLSKVGSLVIFGGVA